MWEGGSASPEMCFKNRKIEIIIATATDSKRSLFSTIVTDEKEFSIYSIIYIYIHEVAIYISLAFRLAEIDARRFVVPPVCLRSEWLRKLL